ncbi:serine/threonine-protein phosphatase [Flammeovirga yaeyamensis]|uniref:Serine/threonine-protein phosphatase n=1 Tax=Flammeovirga yaeyamensis TaxID=367791 RepID=A0AAX1N1M8_9BACT|nr:MULTISPECIES: SpoIIE family protein phosphatase [Flammeovirga]ANQ48308.1 SpoIIE family protein phosphatase [Flammeovirga sp. MY04]MBB3696209.1 serine phosphatase RsbU (regulator of sigma subunit) [Flammeovirga yaeyamensis]QWG00281.1 serine/threonine-protein phosphatase [Flammeovirga yaeyamensis]
MSLNEPRTKGVTKEVAYHVESLFEKSNLDSIKLILDKYKIFIDKNSEVADQHWLNIQLSHYFRLEGLLDSAEKYGRISYQIAEDSYDLQLLAESNILLARIYLDQNKTVSALNLLKVAHKIVSETNDAVKKASILIDIGEINLQFKKYVTAYEHFDDIENLKNSSNSHHLAYLKNKALLNKGKIHIVLKEYNELTKIIKKLDAQKSISLEKDFEGYIQLLLLKGELAIGLNDLKLAKKILLLAVKEANRKQISYAKLNAYIDLGNYYLKVENYTKAYEAFEKAYVICKQTKNLEKEYTISLELAKTLQHINKDQSIYFYKKSLNLSDSLFNKEKLAAVVDMQTFYEVENQKSENVKLEELEFNQKVKLQQRTQVLYFAMAILFILLVFIYYIFHIQKKTKRLNTRLSMTNDELEMAKEAVEDINQDLEAKNEILKVTLEHSNEQSKQLNYQNNKINSSIKSAHLIQSSILTSSHRIDKAFEDNFIFNQPKDIISGDFYWFVEIEGWKIYACVDCTGHGVPGALMSMMGNSLLYEIVRGNKVFQPSVILTELNKLVVHNLQQEHNDNNDGMDMSLIAIKENDLYFSGAKNPLYIVRDGELTKLKGTRKSIGGDLNNIYEQHHWTIEKGDMVYMTTDGYQDQFGGSKARKFMVGQLRDLFTDIANYPTDKQKKILSGTINDWMKEGRWEQVDDMLVLGIRF